MSAWHTGVPELGLGSLHSPDFKNLSIYDYSYKHLYTSCMPNCDLSRTLSRILLLTSPSELIYGTATRVVSPTYNHVDRCTPCMPGLFSHVHEHIHYIFNSAAIWKRTVKMQLLGHELEVKKKKMSMVRVEARQSEVQSKHHVLQQFSKQLHFFKRNLTWKNEKLSFQMKDSHMQLVILILAMFSQWANNTVEAWWLMMQWLETPVAFEGKIPQN